MIPLPFLEAWVMERRTIVLGSDHAGYNLKARIRRILESWGVPFEDVGVETDAVSVDYPDIAAEVARRVQCDPQRQGLLVCGTGIGMAMTANKFPGIRAAVCHDVYTVQMARAHNDANVLCMGGRVLAGIDDETLASMLRAWLETPFEGGRHERRVAKIRALETTTPVECGKTPD
jgi:ribose 5-phosphate isomerase B